MSQHQLISDLRQTKQVLAERGRCTQTLTGVDGKVCLDGAVGVACLGSSKFSYSTLVHSGRAMAVLTALDAHVPAECRGLCEDDGPLENVFVYNDLATTTDQDCYNLIDKAIAEAGGMA